MKDAEIANACEGYFCEDCNSWLSKTFYAEHDASHTLLKQTLIEGWGIKKALESRNSSALKELRKKVEAKSKTLEEVRVDLNPLSLDMKRMLLEHYDWFISEIDSLLQQEGVKA